MSFESRLELAVDSRSGERNLKRFEGQLTRTERAGTGLVGALGGIRRVVGLAAAAVGGLSLGRLVRETAAFEDSMLGLEAVTQATAKQMGELEKQARTLGATSMFSAQQAGDAQRFLAQAGFEVNEILSATPGILDLAAAGQMGLAEAADIASNVLGGMRLEVEQLGRVNDVLAATASGANTNIQQLGQALSFAAPFAAAAGVSIEDTAAAIGAMSDAGIQASRAGTGLVGIIRQLSRLTPAAESALTDAGLSVEQVNIEARGLQPVLKSLSEAGLDVGQAIEIFGSEAGAAALNVIEAADSMSDFSAELENAEGSAKRMAQVIGSGLTGSMRSFSSMLSESIINLGRDQGVAGGLQSVLDSASGVLAVYNDMLPTFAEANDLTAEQASRLETVARVLQGTAGAIGGMVAAYGLLRGAIILTTAAQWALNAAMRANPIGLVITAVAGLTGGLFALREELGLTSDAAYQSSIDVDGLAASFRDLTRAQQENTKASLVGNLVEMRMEAARVGNELNEVSRLTRNSGQLTPQGGALPVATAEDIARGRELREERGMLLADIEAGTGLLNEYEAAMADLGETEEQATTRTRELATSTTELADTQREATREADELARSMDRLLDRLFPLEAAQRRYMEDLQLLNSVDWSERTMTQAQAQERLATAYQDTLVQLGAYNDAFEAYSSLFEPTQQGIEGMNRAMLDAEAINAQFAYAGARGIQSFAKDISEGRNAVDSLGDAFRNFASDFLMQISQMIAQQAIFNAMQSMPGGGVGGAVTSFTDMIGLSGGGHVGYAAGGYTGNGGKMEPAGIVHKGEFVVQKAVTQQPGVLPFLTRLNKGFAEGGHVGRAEPVPAQPQQQAVSVKNVNVFDANDVLDQAMADSAGQKVMLNYIKSNRSAVRGALGV